MFVSEKKKFIKIPTLDARQLRINRLPKNKVTSGMSKCPATAKLANRLATPSLRGLHNGICDPVITIVLHKCSNIKLSAEAVYLFNIQKEDECTLSKM